VDVFGAGCGAPCFLGHWITNPQNVQRVVSALGSTKSGAPQDGQAILW
jgi:hypothetical protein